MKTLVICLCLFFSTIIKAQSDQINPYIECLKFHLKSLKERNHLKDTIYLQPNDFLNLTSGPFEGTYIKVVNERLVKEKTMKGKMIGVIVVNPVMFDNNVQSISVTHFSVTRKKNHYYYNNSGGTKMILHYECKEGIYKYEIVASH